MLQQAIAIYAGGPGSGCNPAAGRCGRIPRGLEGLASEARKAASFNDFESDFLGQIKHGRYYHVTKDPNFKIDPQKGPKDASSMADGSTTAGKLMVTSDLDNWTTFYGKSRPYVAVIDMSDVPRQQYYQVNRGFGNEFYVNDPSRARVSAVVPVAKARQQDRQYDKLLSSHFNSSEDLQRFYTQVTGRK